MNKRDAIIQSYQIATLTYPSSEILDLLMPLPFERVLELLLIIRQSSKPVKSPYNFLKRAVLEGWTPETIPQPIDRRLQNRVQSFYSDRGLSYAEILEICRK